MPGGLDGIVIAVDTVGTGQNTSYPSSSDIIALQIPFEDGAFPHSVVAGGPCVGKQVQNITTSQSAGLRHLLRVSAGLTAAEPEPPCIIRLVIANEAIDEYAH